MTELENISSLSKLLFGKKEKPKTPTTKTIFQYKFLEEKKIKPWFRSTWIAWFKAKREPPHTQPKEESAITEHPVIFMLLLFFTMSIWAIISLESSLCLQSGLKKLVSVLILCHCVFHLTLLFGTLNPFCFSSLSVLIKKVSQQWKIIRD